MVEKIKKYSKILKSTAFLLLLIVLLGSFLRLYKLGEKSFVADEFLGVNATYGFLQTGQWKRWDFNWDSPLQDKPYPRFYFDLDIWEGGPETYVRAWMYNWQVAQSLKFLSPEKESSYRLVSALWGIASVLLTYFVAKKITGKRKIALMAAFFMAISLSSVVFSRKVRMYAMFVPVFFAFSYYLFNFLESKRKTKINFLEKINKQTELNFIYFFPVVLLGFLSAHLHPLALNIVPAVLIYFLIMAIIHYARNKKILSKYSVYLAITVLLGLVALALVEDLASFTGGTLELLTHFSYLSIILSDYSGWVLAFILILIGNFYLVSKKQKEGIFFSTIFWAILLFALFLWKKNVGERFILFIKPFQVLLLASGIFAVAEFLKKNAQRHSRKIFFACMAVLLLAVPNVNGFFGPNGPYEQTSKSSEPNYRKVFSHFMKKKQPGDVLVTRNFRNFYFRDAKIKVFSLGGERTEKEKRKVDLKDLKRIVQENPCGWMIFSDNDEIFISKEAQEYVAKNLEKVSNSSVRGPISVIRWCAENSN